MNAIVKFRKCTLSDRELVERIDIAIDKMYSDSGEIPRISIPARPNNDFDLLVGELLFRFADCKNIDIS